MHLLLARTRRDLPNDVHQGPLLLSTLRLGGVVQVLMQTDWLKVFQH